jgi:cytochrome P450
MLRYVALEGLRLYCPIKTMERRAVKPTNIKGYLIPRGTVVKVFLERILVDEQSWKEPLVFKPERWSRVNLTPMPTSFLAFGVGKYKCPVVGKGKDNSAIDQIMIVLAILLKHYQVSSNGNGSITMSRH